MRDLFFATPGAAQIPEDRAQRARPGGRCGASGWRWPVPAIAFTVIGDDERVLLRLPAAASREARLRGACSGPRFRRQFGAGRRPSAQGFRLTGLIGLPTLNRGLPRDQYLFVNGRPVRDKLLVGAVRGAYQDVLARDRHPVVALFLDGPAAEIDVNVHPGQGRGALPRCRR